MTNFPQPSSFSTAPDEGYPDNISCSFCHIHRSAAYKIIAGPTQTIFNEEGHAEETHVCICDACVRLCVSVLAENSAAPALPQQRQKEEGIGLRGLLRLVFGKT